MSDGMTGWERMLADQAAELEKLRGFLADYEATLKAMRSAVARALADGEQSERLREALRVVRSRIDRSVAAEWWGGGGIAYGNSTGGAETLLEYVTRVLDENAANSCADGGAGVGRDEADKPKPLNDSGFRG